jgi:hypothetical protein
MHFFASCAALAITKKNASDSKPDKGSTGAESQEFG